jgi:hypothetical protein
MEATRMLVIYRNGKRVVVSGWRAWLIVAPAVLIAALVVVAVISLLLGIALTVFTVLLFVVPVAIALALLVRQFNGQSSGPPAER